MNSIKITVSIGLIVVLFWMTACTTYSLAPYVECREYTIHVDTMSVMPDSVKIVNTMHYTQNKIDSVSYTARRSTNADECRAGR